jgi:phosphoserine aminotransferase
MKKHNFYAGPSILPEFTKEKTAEAVINFAGTGLSVMEDITSQQGIRCCYG